MPPICALTPAQEATFDGLLSVGLPRPYAPEGVADMLRGRLDGAAAVAARWTEPGLFVSKSLLVTVRRCEGQSLADAERSAGGALPLPAAVGVVAHRAIKLAHTHPGWPVAGYVDLVLDGDSDPGLRALLADADPLAVSDLRTKAVERVAAFADSWPPLDERWTPRFERSLQARHGPLMLAARADLMLGRPRADGRQTMLLVDFKSGALQDAHRDEALFYALVATLRFGVPPFRSTVFSLSSGYHTDADVDVDRLAAAADWTAEAIIALVDVRTGPRPPQLIPDRHCGWCPTAPTCPATTTTATTTTTTTTTSRTSSTAAGVAVPPSPADDRDPPA